jgi:putative ABC transport system substrate-binding protein
MNRRTFLAIVAGGLLASSLAAEAQSARRLPQLCFLTFDPGTARSPSPRFAAFFRGLQDLGYVNERTIAVHYLSANGRNERFPELVAECVRLKPDIIVATTTPAALAAKNATRTIPIVMVALGDPQGTGLVESLARPGGNITGMSQMTSGLAAKRLELLKEAVPRISRVLVLSFLVDPIAPLQVKALKEVAPSLGVSLLVHDIRTAEDLPAAFDAGVRERAEGLLTTAESIFLVQRARVTELAARHRLPAIYPYSAFVIDADGLMAYSINNADLHRRAATYVDKILKGSKPSDLAVQQPTNFQLVVNLKTAKALGLPIPPSFLQRADQVIE